jgi:hypothetical protein
MKLTRSLFIAAILTSISTYAFGAPFLVSDPYPAKDSKLSKFVVTIDGKTSDSTPAKNPDGSLYLKYDLGGLQDGTYTITIKAVGTDGKESSPAAYSFKKTGSQVEPYTPPEPKRKIPPSRSYPGHTNR